VLGSELVVVVEVVSVVGGTVGSEMYGVNIGSAFVVVKIAGVVATGSEISDVGVDVGSEFEGIEVDSTFGAEIKGDGLIIGAIGSEIGSVDAGSEVSIGLDTIGSVLGETELGSAVWATSVVVNTIGSAFDRAGAG